MPPGYTWKKMFSDGDIKNIIESYKTQNTFDISLDYDCASSTIRKVLIENNVELRKPGKQKGKKD